MKQDDDIIDYLLAGKLAGSLNDEELIEINTLITEDNTIRERWNSLIAALPASGVSSSFSEMDNPDKWATLTFTAHKPKAIIPLFLKKMAVAAASTGIVVSSYFYFFHTPKTTTPTAVAATTNSIQLKLANGQVIDLSKEDSKVATREAEINNTKKTLTYTVTGKEQTGFNSLTVPIGKDYKITLNDGTEVWLNSSSQLTFPFTFNGDTREISINGEAYLKIAPNATKPFIVHLPHNKVQVLGTEFNVNSYDSGIVKVALVQGAVNVVNNSTTKSLQPGMEAIAKGEKIVTGNFDRNRVLSWKRGIYYFYDADLKEISKVLPRWFGINTVIDNPEIMRKKFAGGVDRNQPIEVFIDNLKTVAGVECYFDKESNTLHFK